MPKWLEVDQDNLHVKFSALNVDFSSSKLRPPAFKEALQRRIPPKNGYFTTIGLFSTKAVADRLRHAAYHNKHW